MKGQGLSITTIVVAAIALIVLVVLVAVFTGNIGKTSEGLADCRAAGGECLTQADLNTKKSNNPNIIYSPAFNKECPSTDLRCYVSVNEKQTP